ncbi:MAG: HNH endonuclease, partial [Chloroflexota bacterium]
RSHEIDHIEAEKHGGMTIEVNLCFCCWICNRHKGTDLTSRDPETGQVTLLYHPRKNLWSDHFRLDGARIEGLTPVGRVTVKLLQMNKSTRVKEREILISLNRFPL